MINRNNKRSVKKLWVEVHEELYDKLQQLAKKRNITFTKYINRSLLRSLLRDELHENSEKEFNR